jgi:peptide-methionine (S)-S-oxide reductase
MKPVAYFAEGCFWHAEIVFQSLVGVRDAVSGFSGGKVKNPGYEAVCSGKTGHAETVAVYYDPLRSLMKHWLPHSSPAWIRPS